MPKTIIISNRLPVKIESNGGLSSKPSEGGLATGLGSVYKKGNNLWIGWPGIALSKKADKDYITAQLKKDNMLPVFLSEKEVKDFYEGFSNETLWPNFHYFNEYTKYDEALWKAYVRVNQKFCTAVIKHIEEGDKIWVHDYQLLLLPEMIRKLFPHISIGFFQHIPFPSYETFRNIPWRKELLEGMLGSDLVGFHTYDDMRHFLSSVNRIVGMSNSHGQIDLPDRIVNVDIFPMGIDYEKYAKAASHANTKAREVRYRSNLGSNQLILSIDRLDYSKGIPQRLKAYELFLEKYPEYAGKASLLMLVVPSRDEVEKYKEIKEEIELLVGRINGKYGRINWTPVYYFYRSLPLYALSAFYVMSDVALVTPMRDGMNLVCKEYIASKQRSTGVLILSEMAGASKELSDAILVNPSDINQIVEAIYMALTMSEEEQSRRLEMMQKTISTYNIHHWVNLFMESLDKVKLQQELLLTKQFDKEAFKNLKKDYRKSRKRILFLDYDGTLVGFTGHPKQSVPDEELNKILCDLTRDKRNKVVIISGRDKKTLNQWMKPFDVDIICEHGIWIKNANKRWSTLIDLDNGWKPDIKEILDAYVDKTPGSFVEEKEYSLVWHYRRVETGLGELRTRELMSHLKYMVSDEHLQVLEGNRVVEIKNNQVNKGVAATRWTEEYPNDFIMAIGDDWTDEDTFKALPDSAYTLKVGGGISSAKYGITDHYQVRELLKALTKTRRSSNTT
jgi:trehalose 6-phosphate synthase/phosphatase